MRQKYIGDFMTKCENRSTNSWQKYTTSPYMKSKLLQVLKKKAKLSRYRPEQAHGDPVG
jgi:hypothetical protein